MLPDSEHFDHYGHVHMTYPSVEPMKLWMLATMSRPVKIRERTMAASKMPKRGERLINSKTPVP